LGRVQGSQGGSTTHSSITSGGRFGAIRACRLFLYSPSTKGTRQISRQTIRRVWHETVTRRKGQRHFCKEGSASFRSTPLRSIPLRLAGGGLPLQPPNEDLTSRSRFNLFCAFVKSVFYHIFHGLARRQQGRGRNRRAGSVRIPAAGNHAQDVARPWGSAPRPPPSWED